MKNKELLEEFHSLAKKLDVKIMKGKGDFSGGSCIVNEEKVIENQSFDMLRCHTPHIKFGIYRPGNNLKKNLTSFLLITSTLST